MLGRLYMFQGKYSKAKDWLEKVIKSGKYEMETNYIDCFTDQKDNGRERVYGRFNLQVGNWEKGKHSQPV